MTGQSLFPEEYPIRESRRVDRPPCCTGLTYPEEIPDRLWDFAHALGHSRVPFTVAALALGAQATHGDALTATRLAEEAGWLDRVLPDKWETAKNATRWIGCLQRRR